MGEKSLIFFCLFFHTTKVRRKNDMSKHFSVFNIFFIVFYFFRTKHFANSNFFLTFALLK